MINYSELTNDQLYIKYQETKTNFRNAPEGSKKEFEADIIFNELSNEMESREDFNWLEYKTVELEQQKELLQGLINQIEALEDEGMSINDILLMYLYNNTKHLNIKPQTTLNNIPQSIKVFAK